jgi:hypothetical protein
MLIFYVHLLIEVTTGDISCSECNVCTVAERGMQSKKADILQLR